MKIGKMTEDIVLIGLTGSIASGKSLVAGFFKERGIPVVDADLVARFVVRVGTSVNKKIGKLFGSDFILSNGEINRRKIRNVIFSDEKKRIKYEKIIHPAIRSEILRRIEDLKNKNHNLIVVDAALMFEKGLNKLMDKTILVWTYEDLAIKRSVKRDKVSIENVKNILNSQMTVSEKKKLADFLIENSGSVEETRKNFEKVLKEIL